MIHVQFSAGSNSDSTVASIHFVVFYVLKLSSGDMGRLVCCPLRTIRGYQASAPLVIVDRVRATPT